MNLAGFAYLIFHRQYLLSEDLLMPPDDSRKIKLKSTSDIVSPLNKENAAPSSPGVVIHLSAILLSRQKQIASSRQLSYRILN